MKRGLRTTAVFFAVWVFAALIFYASGAPLERGSNLAYSLTMTAGIAVWAACLAYLVAGE